MNLKFIIKALSLLSLTSFAFADDCGDIKDYLKKKFGDDVVFEDIIGKCNMDDQGKVKEL